MILFVVVPLAIVYGAIEFGKRGDRRLLRVILSVIVATPMGCLGLGFLFALLMSLFVTVAELFEH